MVDGCGSQPEMGVSRPNNPDYGAARKNFIRIVTGSAFSRLISIKEIVARFAWKLPGHAGNRAAAALGALREAACARRSRDASPRRAA
jgi:hypothetical protein